MRDVRFVGAIREEFSIGIPAIKFGFNFMIAPSSTPDELVAAAVKPGAVAIELRNDIGPNSLNEIETRWKAILGAEAISCGERRRRNCLRATEAPWKTRQPANIMRRRAREDRQRSVARRISNSLQGSFKLWHEAARIGFIPALLGWTHVAVPAEGPKTLGVHSFALRDDRNRIQQNEEATTRRALSSTHIDLTGPLRSVGLQSARFMANGRE